MAPTPLERAPDGLAGARPVAQARGRARARGVQVARGDARRGAVRGRGARRGGDRLYRKPRRRDCVGRAARRHRGASHLAPSGASETKLALLRQLGADVRIVGGDLDEAKDAARAHADAESLAFFEDGAEPLQYDAYGAIADELLDQATEQPAAVVIPVGNGALAGGMGACSGGALPEPCASASSRARCR